MTPIDADKRLSAEGALGYTFVEPKLLQRALTHSSVSDDRLSSNERLEFLGDAILGCIVCEYLFSGYPDYLEGELTKIKSAVVSRRVCAQVSDRLGLTELLTLGKGMGVDPSKLPASLAAAVLESCVAAIFLDGGMEPTRAFVLRELVPVIEQAAESAHQDNFKSLLQQHAQQSLDQLPTYLLLDEKGPDHSKCFEVGVEMGGRRFESAWGKTKKQAEQFAARNALKTLGVVEAEEEIGAIGADEQNGVIAE